MIEIKITDPHLMDKDALRRTAAFLLSMTGDSVLHVTGMMNQPAPAAFVPPPPPLTALPLTPEQPQLETPKVNPFAKPVEQPIENVPQRTITPPRAIDPSVELDIRGLPWDNRIHSRTKSKTSDGHWKAMRGLTPDTLKSVEAELFQAMSLPTIPHQAVPLPPTSPLGVAPAAPIVDPIAPPANDFPTLMSKITSAVHAGKTTSAAVLKIVQEMGLPSLPVVATRPDLIPAIMNRLEALLLVGGL